jgi:hypothetical protein
MFATAAWIAALSLVATVAFASSTDSLSDEELTYAAGTIVEGIVTDAQSQWNSGHNQIHTTISISVSNLLKGTMPPGGVLVFEQLGGQVGDIAMDVTGLATFAVGEDVIVFVRNGSAPLTPLVGWGQGKVTITVDAITGVRMVQERGIPRDEFVRTISSIVARQEGGDRR